MSGDFILYIGRRTMETALLLAAPVLGLTLVVGFIVAMIQAVTSVRDMTMGMVLKLLCVGVAVLVFGGWMMNVAVDFTTQVFNEMQKLGG